MVRRVRMRHVSFHVIYPEETERESLTLFFVGNTYTVTWKIYNLLQMHLRA